MSRSILIALLFGSSIVLATHICSEWNMTAQNPTTGEWVQVISLFSISALSRVAKHFFETSLSLWLMFCITMAASYFIEQSSWVRRATHKALRKSSAKSIVPVTLGIGMISHSLGDWGYLLLVPLAPIAFQYSGLPPLAGLVVGFAGVSGGYAANLFLGSVDFILSPITQEAAQIISPNYAVSAFSNWYFLSISTFLIALVGTGVANYVTIPKTRLHHREILSDLSFPTPVRKSTLRFHFSTFMKQLFPYSLFLVFILFLLSAIRISNLPLVLVFNSLDLIKGLSLSPFGLLLGFMFMVCTLDFVMAGALTKWALMAPLFVPLFMMLQISPETTQVAYRISDSITNVISPAMIYFPMILGWANKWGDKISTRKLVLLMLPYSIGFFIAWVGLLYLWLHLGLPLGPKL